MAGPAGAERQAETPSVLFSRWFEELEVGDEFATAGRTVTETDIVAFSAWTGDRHLIHTNRHWAEEHGVHDGIVAHGLLTLSYTVGLIPLAPERIVVMRRIRDVVFKRPAALGDTLRARGRIVELPLRDPFGCVVTRVESVNQRDEVVLRGTFEMLWRRRELATEDELG